MNVKLKPTLERRIVAPVSGGGYKSGEALVHTAIKQLIDSDEMEEACGTDIRRRLVAADREIDRGDFVEYDASTVQNLAKDVHKKGLRRLRSG